MKLKQVCTLSADYGLNIPAESYVDGGVPIIRTSDFDDMGRLALSEAKAVSLFDARDKLLEKGDVLFSRSGTVGRCMVFEETRPCTFAAYLVRFRPRLTQAHPKFIFYWAQSKGFRHQVSVETIESTIGNFNGAKFASLEFPQLAVGQQNEIADFLDRETARIDQLIEKKQRFVRLLNAKISDFADNAVTRGLHRDQAIQTTDVPWLPEMPMHWSFKRAKRIYRETNRPPLSEDGIITAFRDGQVVLREKRRTEGFTFAIQEVGYQHINCGDLVIHTMDAFAGAIGVSEDNGKSTGEYAVCEAIDSRTNNFYYAHVLRCIARRDYIYVLCPSVRERAPRFRFVRFAPIFLPVPPLNEQDQIVTAIERQTWQLRQLRDLTEKSLHRLDELRSALITAAVTGQIDVATWSKRGETDRRLERIEEKMSARGALA